MANGSKGMEWVRTAALVLLALLGWAYGLGHKLGGLDGGQVAAGIQTLQVELKAMQDAAAQVQQANQREFDRLEVEIAQIQQTLETRK